MPLIHQWFSLRLPKRFMSSQHVWFINDAPTEWEWEQSRNQVSQNANINLGVFLQTNLQSKQQIFPKFTKVQNKRNNKNEHRQTHILHAAKIVQTQYK